MLVSVKGTFEKGEVKLSEPPPVNEKQEVIITFPGDSNTEAAKSQMRKGGSLSGKIWMAPDFNAPLVIDESLDQYNGKVLFPEQLAKANEVLKRIGLPKLPK